MENIDFTYKIDINKINKYRTKYFQDNLIFNNNKSFYFNSRKFNLLKKLNSGTYGNIFEYQDYNNNYILKIPNEDLSESKIATNAEIIILSILNAFQQIYQKDIVSEIYKIFKDTNMIKFPILMKKYNDDIFEKFKNINVLNKTDLYLVIDLIIQISHHLMILQYFFNFMHNDLKPNNIFFYLKNKEEGFKLGNIKYIIGDFGGSFIQFNNTNIFGIVRRYDNVFNPNKDMFMMIHILYTFINTEYKSNAKKLFTKLFGSNMNYNYTEYKNNEWFNIYDIEEIPNVFNPKNVFNRILKLFPNLKLNHFISKKYKINYS